MWRVVGAAGLGVWLAMSAPAPPAVTIDIAARALQPGEAVLITVTADGAPDDVKIRAFDRDVQPWRADARTWRALAGIDLDLKPGKYSIVADAGAAKSTRPVTVLAKQFRTRTLTVDEAFVNPPASVQPRIEEEAKALATLWTQSASSREWSAGFVAPVPQPANSAFGTRSVFNGQPRSAHGGADFGSPAGTPVKAPNAGTVVLARNLYYTGNTVVIDHGLGLFSLLAHLMEISATEKSAVALGDVVGRVGATGRVTGPHLHWTVRLGGARVDPVSLLEVLKQG